LANIYCISLTARFVHQNPTGARLDHSIRNLVWFRRQAVLHFWPTATGSGLRCRKADRFQAGAPFHPDRLAGLREELGGATLNKARRMV